MIKSVHARLSLVLFPLTLVIYFLLNLWIIIASNAHALLNDFWFLKQISERTTWNDPSGFYDGFFPYLYPLILKFVPTNSILHTTALISLFAACLTILFVYLAAKEMVGSKWALVAVWIIALQPQFFTYATVSSADVLAALPVAIAFWVLVKARPGSVNGLLRALFLASLLIGIGSSLRYHTQLLVIVPFALALTLRNSKLRATLVVIGGFLIGYLPQIIVNAFAGQLPWSTLQGFNMYRQVVGVDWNTTDSLDPSLYSSPLAVIFDNPVPFTSIYLTTFSNFIFPLVVIVTAAFLSTGSRWSPIMWSATIGATFFALVSSTAFSDRTLIVFMPIWALSAAWIFQRGDQFIRRLTTRKAVPNSPLTSIFQGTLVAALLLWGTLPWIQADFASGIARSELEVSRANNEVNFLSETNVASMNEVFTNDFNFYTLKIPGFIPHHNGGIAAISQKGTSLAPNIDVSGIQPFLCDSLQRQIQATIWNSGNGSGTESGLNEVLSGQIPDSQIVTQPTSGLVISNIELSSYPCE